MEFKCKNGQCVSSVMRCDGHPDCWDHSDEESCTTAQICTTKHRCPQSKECLVQEWICDGDQDCKDGSDEKVHARQNWLWVLIATMLAKQMCIHINKFIFYYCLVGLSCDSTEMWWVSVVLYIQDPVHLHKLEVRRHGRLWRREWWNWMSVVV